MLVANVFIEENSKEMPKEIQIIILVADMKKFPPPPPLTPGSEEGGQRLEREEGVTDYNNV